jgi:hypothetical protein
MAATMVGYCLYAPDDRENPSRLEPAINPQNYSPACSCFTKPRKGAVCGESSSTNATE